MEHCYLSPTIVVPKKPAGVHEITKTKNVVVQMAQIHQMIKNMMTSFDASACILDKVVIGANVVACVCYGGAHLFEECSTNHVFMNYVRNHKYNNPFNNTYNPGLRNYPNFSWSGLKHHKFTLVFLHKVMLWLYGETTS